MIKGIIILNHSKQKTKVDKQDILNTAHAINTFKENEQGVILTGYPATSKLLAENIDGIDGAAKRQVLKALQSKELPQDGWDQRLVEALNKIPESYNYAILVGNYMTCSKHILHLPQTSVFKTDYRYANGYHLSIKSNWEDISTELLIDKAIGTHLIDPKGLHPAW